MSDISFVVRYFSCDGHNHWDLVIDPHNLNLPRNYGFFTSLCSFIDFYGNYECDICRDAINLRKWPSCYVYLRVGSELILICRGESSFNHHGEPNGYRLF